MSDTNPSFGPYNNAPASQGGQNNTPSANPTAGYGNTQPNSTNAYPAYNGQAKQPAQPTQNSNTNNDWQHQAPAYQYAPQQGQNQQQRPQGYTTVPSSAPTQPMGGQHPYQAPNVNPNMNMGAAAHSEDLPYYGCSFVEAIKRFFTKYVVFSGRASRSEYWWAQLFLFIVWFVLVLLGRALFGRGSNYLVSLWNLAVLIPSIAIMIRRLHDSNKSGWWALLPYGLLVVGVIAMIAFMGIGAVAGGGDLDALAGGTFIGFIIYGLCFLGYFISWLVLMISGSNPAGARFDNRVVVPANMASPTSSIPMPTGATQPQNRNMPNGAANNGRPYGQNGFAPTQTPTGYNQQPKQATQPQTTTPNATQQAQQPYTTPRVPSAQQPASAAPQPDATQQQGYQPYTGQPGTPTQNGNQPRQ